MLPISFNRAFNSASKSIVMGSSLFGCILKPVGGIAKLEVGEPFNDALLVELLDDGRVWIDDGCGDTNEIFSILIGAYTCYDIVWKI